MPVLLDMSTGYFVMPPSNDLLKVARHSYGYQNPPQCQLRCRRKRPIAPHPLLSVPRPKPITPTGDFLVDYHPNWKGLFVATGDSGHAFKFLPILGDKVVECILGSGPLDMRQQWSWAANQSHSVGHSVTTEDGSMAGTPGILLTDVWVRCQLE
ncbi:uncharacterized protein MKZ38_001374 [Zalerion maritima]|uniref:Uncharacterized protein n=1 Tax=Zalerion maritima TaxID=339359 RepID=A0AAD5RRV5_9PEZI|nr:uncharacterized protein MKZ38_001374 [Zalerion maritima]